MISSTSIVRADPEITETAQPGKSDQKIQASRSKVEYRFLKAFGPPRSKSGVNKIMQGGNAYSPGDKQAPLDPGGDGKTSPKGAQHGHPVSLSHFGKEEGSPSGDAIEDLKNTIISVPVKVKDTEGAGKKRFYPICFADHDELTGGRGFE
jgi:hypothetical protein